MRKTLYSATVAAAATIALVGLTACSSDSSSAGSSGMKIGLSVSTLNNPFFVSLRDGAQAAAASAGVSLTVTDAQNDASQQANQIQNFTSQNVKAIIINPVDSDAAGPSVKAAGSASIPVVAADRTVNNAKIAATVASDNVAGGKQAAQEMGAELKGQGEIVILQGVAGTSAARDRGAGFTEGIKAFPGIKVVAQQPADFDRTKGLDVMTNLLQAHPNITGVFAQNDEMALGAIKALGTKAGSTVKVIGFDGTDDGLKAVSVGTLSATVAQQPKELGKLAVENAVKAAKGEKIDSVVNVPVKVVTSKDVKQFTS